MTFWKQHLGHSHCSSPAPRPLSLGGQSQLRVTQEGVTFTPAASCQRGVAGSQTACVWVLPSLGSRRQIGHLVGLSWGLRELVQAKQAQVLNGMNRRGCGASVSPRENAEGLVFWPREHLSSVCVCVQPGALQIPPGSPSASHHLLPPQAHSLHMPWPSPHASFILVF